LKKKNRLLRIIAICFAGIIVFFAIIIFIVNTTFSVDSVKKQQESVLTGMVSLKDKSGKLFVVNDRIANISSLLRSRKDYSPIINKLTGLVPDQAAVSGIQLDQKTISLIVVSDSLLPLDSFLNGLINLTTKKELIKNLSIDSLTTVQKTGKFSLSISAELL